jgi:gliding motility-associated-like protein
MINSRSDYFDQAVHSFLKKIICGILTIIFLFSSLRAQNTPAHYFHSPATATPLINLFGPFQKTMSIYTQTEIASMTNPVATSITIDTIWLRHGGTFSNVSTTLTNFAITLGHTTLSLAVDTFQRNFNAGLPQVVFSAASYTYTPNSGLQNLPANNWTPIALQNPFTYNFIDNLAIQIEYSGSSGVIMNTYAFLTLNTVTQFSMVAADTVATGCIARPMIGFSAGCGPPVLLGADTTVCQGQNLILNSGIMGQQYLWSTGDTTASINVNTSGIYSVQVTNGACQSSDSIQVNMLPILLINLGNDTIICPSSQLFLDADNPGATYLWSTGSNQQTISVTASGSYSVEVSSNGNCPVKDSILVMMSAEPDLGGVLSLCGNLSGILLNAGNQGATYQWSTGETSQTILVEEAGLYNLTINTGACILTDTVEVIGTAGEGMLYIPNTITANNDGLNDFFEVKGSNIYSFQIRIYNRWGELIYESVDPTFAWDGKYNEQPVPEGTYVYVIDYITNCSGHETTHRYGHVNVIR